MIDYDNFQKTIKNLQLYKHFYDVKLKDENATEEDFEVGKTATIKGYEMCYEAMIKALTRYLHEDKGVLSEKVFTKDLFRVANEYSVLSSDIENWLNYYNARNITTHEYGQEKIEYVFSILSDFIDDMIGLYQTMSGKSWE